MRFVECRRKHFKLKILITLNYNLAQKIMDKKLRRSYLGLASAAY